MVIQTYAPEHYAIEAAAKQDYQAFYREEKAYRSLLSYPPFCHVLAVFMEHDKYEELCRLSDILKDIFGEATPVRRIGPCDATIAKVNDRYRRVIYLKHEEYDRLVEAKNIAEEYLEGNAEFKDCHVSFDFDPIHGY